MDEFGIADPGEEQQFEHDHMRQLARLPDGLVEGDQFPIGQQFWQPFRQEARGPRPAGARMLKDLLEIVIVGVLRAEQAHQFLGHRFGRRRGRHQAASKKEGRSRSSANSP